MPRRSIPSTEPIRMPVEDREGAFSSLKYSPFLASLPISWLPYLELTRVCDILGLPVSLLFYFIGLFYGACLTWPVIQPDEFLALSIRLSLWAIVMHYAQVAWNDLVDADLDRKVPRKSFRPLVRGAITSEQALNFIGVLFGLGLIILTCLPRRSYEGAFVTTLTMMAYPFVKRVVYYKPVIRAAGHITAILQGMVTVGAKFSLPSGHSLSTACLGLTCFLIIVIVDTVDAFQSARDDAKEGIKSLPVLLDDRAVRFLRYLTSVVAVLLCVIGYINDFSPFYYLIPCISCFALFSAMLVLVDLRIPADCSWWFMRAYFGALGFLLWGFFAEYCFRVLLFN